MKYNLLLNTIALLLGVACIPSMCGANKCPPPEDIMPCRCRGRNEQIQVWCSHSDLERVNGALENLMKLRNMPAIDELIVENNRMPTLPARAFGALRIGRLLLRNNGLESLSRNAFAGLEDTIEELYIVEDKLVDFPFDAIENLRNLEAFTVEKSQIRLLPRFNGLNRLKHIRIDGSLISSFPVGAFASMASIKQIHVVNSAVSSLAAGIFGPLETLLLANFSGNRIDFIQRRSFALLPKLEVLSLSNNNIEDAVAVGRATEELFSLKSLDLSKNKIKLLPEGSFVNLRTLQMLILASNQIQQVNTRSFTHLPALRKVDLSDNQIRNLPAHFFDAAPLLEELRLRKNLLGTAGEIGEVLSTLKSLRFLDLGENGFTVLPSHAIQDHTQLQRLDLSDNKITKIQRNAFTNVPSLVEMSLRNNSIQEMGSDGEVWEIPSLKELDMSSNSLQSLPMSVLKGMPRIARIDLSYNSIKTVAKGVFSFCKELELLDMTGNGINQFASDALQGLTRLNKLDLSRNHITSLAVGTFRDLQSLQSLNLASNRINNLPGNLFQDLKSLEELSLKSNSLNHLAQGLFAQLENLKELNLKHNSIADVHNKVFAGLRNLETLKMSSNQITRIDDTGFDDLQKLRIMDISSNRINRFPERAFRSLKSLEKLEARENRITSIAPGAFTNCEKLQILDLANNALSQLPEALKSVPSVKVIDLSHNQIDKLEMETFKSTLNIVELYLNNNKIKNLETKVFSDLSSLTILDLDGNEIEDIRTETFSNLPRLIYLRLSRNKIRNIRNAAFSDLMALDGLDLQENDLESIADSAFEKTGALKYLNLSHNNFDSMSRMGLFPLNSLEVLDTSFNRIKEIDRKSVRHLQWLVELRMNDNGICQLPVGAFDGLNRLKMLVLRNNFITHIYESVFYKLKNNIAFLDISGNPLVCDCELTWLRNLLTREAVAELIDSTCESPNELKGKLIKDVRPTRFLCSSGNGLGRGIPPLKTTEECPDLPKSKRRPRPVSPPANERPFFGTNPVESSDYVAESDQSTNDVRKKKDEKLSESDYTPGDTPTIYAGSASSSKVGSATNEGKNSGGGFSALGTLFGFPLPSLDFGLDLGITPSFILADPTKPNKNEETDRGFNTGLKGPEPLPPSWLDRPSKADVKKHPQNVYEPPEYIPRKPPQPYIPLNPYTEANVVPSGSRDVQKAVSPGASPPSGESASRLTVKGGKQTRPPPPSWHPSYPTAETGFIPIEPFFHAVKGPTTNNQPLSHNIDKKVQNQDSSSGSIAYYSTTPRPLPYKTTLSPNLPAFSEDYLPQTSSQRPDAATDDIFASPSPSSNQPLEYEEDGRNPSYTPVSVQNPDNNNQGDADGFSLSDFWGMFNERDNFTTKDKPESDRFPAHPVQLPMPHPDDHDIEDDYGIPLNFSDPVDTISGLESSSTMPPFTTQHPEPQRFSSSEATLPINLGDPQIDNQGGDNLYHFNHPSQFPESSSRRPAGKSTITKVTMDEINTNNGNPPGIPNVAPPAASSHPPVHANPHHHPHHQNKGEPSQPQKLIPPVIIGKREEPLDWYYTNYNGQSNREDAEKFLERSRINFENQNRRSSSSSSLHKSSFSSLSLLFTLSCVHVLRYVVPTLV